MTQHPLVPFVNLYQNDPRDTYRPETEREIFERIANTMREDQRRERRNRVRPPAPHLRRRPQRRPRQPPGRRQPLNRPDGAGRHAPSRPVLVSCIESAP